MLRPGQELGIEEPQRGPEFGDLRRSGGIESTIRFMRKSNRGRIDRTYVFSFNKVPGQSLRCPGRKIARRFARTQVSVHVSPTLSDIACPHSKVNPRRATLWSQAAGVRVRVDTFCTRMSRGMVVTTHKRIGLSTRGKVNIVNVWSTLHEARAQIMRGRKAMTMSFGIGITRMDWLPIHRSTFLHQVDSTSRLLAVPLHEVRSVRNP